MKEQRSPEPNESTNNLSIDELIRIELQGKKVAMGRYDTILWQIKSGYMLVLYGTLGFAISKGQALQLSVQIVTLVCWFSLLAFLVDLAFRQRQLRVVQAYNRLVDAMLPKMNDKRPNLSSLGELLHIVGEKTLSMSGESEKRDIPIRECLYPAILIYGGTALISILLYFFKSAEGT